MDGRLTPVCIWKLIPWQFLQKRRGRSAEDPVHRTRVGASRLHRCSEGIMRTVYLASAIGVICVAVAGCHKKLAPHEAERLLAKTYSSPTWTAHFKCQDSERDWLFICQATYQPTALGIQQGLKPNTVPRVGVRLMGTFDGDPVLAYSELPDASPTPSQD